MISRVNKHCTVELQALPQRIGQVRRIVSAQLRYWHLDPLIDPAALAVTELLTNVHQHAEPEKRCTVEIDLVLDQLTVSVRDHDPRLPRIGAAGTGSTHGRGLALVAAVTSSWGVQERQDGGKVVWFTLAVPSAAPAAAPRHTRSAGAAVTFERPPLALPAAAVRTAARSAVPG
ncbi:anti-sigma regulatory factor (Ser/Thr protein kinase) [Streptomyces olivoverticillatus]|uniref:Anti-sigma regulatory factor (Ser/Thr protein kinase) n=1 Tax=Streptomyces olivoverticillatus TaxID=66427 RepID=A0A7W7LQ33_9ACTN|nr:anti-sigma regulatory factor (Ser/Thr protein kinase) [Streptomyces olivoverticillatus]